MCRAGVAWSSFPPSIVQVDIDEITPVRDVPRIPPGADEPGRRTADATGPGKPVPGPVDRVSFFDEQRRHRRATWQLSAFCTLAVLVTGIPVSLVLTPVVHTLALLILTVAGAFVRVPETVWESYRTLFLVLFDVAEQLDRQPLMTQLPRITLAAALMVLPGVAGMSLLWIWLGHVFARAGVGSVLLTLGAREPDPVDLEERQLVNVVEEMAIAAGLPPPRVMMLDADVANAAAIGSSPQDATVLVSGRLLDELDRDDTQGVLGHLVGSIGNGDLRIALTVVRVFQTFGLATTLIAAPVSSKARATLWDLIRYSSLGPRNKDGLDGEADLILSLLTRDLGDVDMDDVDKVLGEEDKRVKGLTSIPLKVRVFALFPLWFAGGMAKIALMMLNSFVLEPLIALMWRTRRYLADATAVQLTRDPDGLGSALTILERSGGVLPGGRWAVHMFVVGSEIAESRVQEQLRQRAEALRGQSLEARVAAGRQLQQELLADIRHQEDTSLTGTGRSMVNFHPPLDKRLTRLQALGARVAVTERPGWSWRDPFQFGASALLTLLFVPLFLLAAWLGVIALGLLMLLVLGATFIYMAIIYGIFSAFH
jgi:Zn-dependent protease with chaperone function